MKKVLWLTSWYPSRVDAFNGDFIQRHALAVAGFCQVHVIYVVKDKGQSGNIEQEKKITGNLTEELIYYRSASTGIQMIDRLLSQRQYNKCYRNAITAYISENGIPDHLHVHIAMKAGLAALWIKEKWGIPYVVTENWTGYYLQSVPSINDHNWLFKRLAKKILKNARLFLPVSKDLGETVCNNLINVPYKVIPNVVDTKLFYYKQASIPTFRFIHASYLNYQKNPEGILAAAKILKTRGHSFEILMLGNKDQRIMGIAKEDGLLDEQVFFEAAVPYQQVATEMQRSSALLLFSRFENLPCVMLEALCCGLPVISSRVGGIAEVIDDSNGILVASEDISALADAMERMIINYSHYQRAEIAAGAAVRFSYDTVGKQYIEAYI